MKSLFDEVSAKCSKITTRKYSTSFSLGILFLEKKMHDPIYAIYGFVRFADEIVDSFHGFDKKNLLNNFRLETYAAIENKISLNPILNSFQKVVHQNAIEMEWIDCFLDSMEMDLYKQDYNQEQYKKYILGSAEVVGLMCLHVFTEGDKKQFELLKPYAMDLGSAFQKINFLRDVKDDIEGLGRTYFPDVNLLNFEARDKIKIEEDIEVDLANALIGIKMLPSGARKGVYLAYYYYKALFKKIKRLPPQKIMNERVRISNYQKMILMFKSNIRHQLNMF
ncbi:MAG: phytoene/squalene synthase family protein [Saprospiraceae bacterium]